jgi:hypothetical protein
MRQVIRLATLSARMLIAKSVGMVLRTALSLPD